MPSKKQPSTSKSRRRVHNKTVAGIKRPPKEAIATTKKQQLIDLLSAAKPVTADKVSKTLDWQPHTVRAAITGLRKTGFVIDSTKGADGGGTCYQIVGKLQSAGAAA